ncbi:MAG: bifunctional 4-hydroxy-2-oxoglutarate aldolase/2-dehydro-3-deoxy-phosphogluconate aldolase [Nodosilinea sp.]
MTATPWLPLLRRHRTIAVIRAPQVELGLRLAEAAAAGGIRLIEITWNSASPERLVTTLRDALPHCHIGVGTLLTVAEVGAAIAAGAEFCVSPHTDMAMIQLARSHDIPLVPGALTPNEIIAAWTAGASAVKVFPIGAVGGASYVKSLQGPLAHIPLIPTGGVTLANAAAMIEAGAVAVGLSTGLFSPAASARGDWPSITEAAARLVEAVQVV